MASPDKLHLTFLRGSGFLHSLIGAWDLSADEAGRWPSQKGFLIFEETTLIAVIERDEKMRRGIEGIYSVEGNRIVIAELSVDTAPEHGALGDLEFELDGDRLTIKWPATHHIDTFERRPEPKSALPAPLSIYESGGRASDV